MCLENKLLLTTHYLQFGKREDILKFDFIK